jgi:cytochrome P450
VTTVATGTRPSGLNGRGVRYPLNTAWSLRRVRQDPIAFLQRLAAHGDAVAFTIGKQHAVLLNHPDHVERVLIADQKAFAKAPAYERARRLLGHGLLTAEGDLHRRRRQLIAPAFHRGLLDSYGQTIVASSVRLLDGWQADQPVDVASAMQRLALSIAGGTLFGARLDDDQAAAVRESLTAAIASIDPLLSLIALPRRVRKGRARLEQVVTQLIDRRSAPDAPGAGGDFLSLLLDASAGDAGGLAQMLDDAITMLLAGHDTIANALTSTWALVAQHADVERRLHRELDEVLRGRLPGAADVAALGYTRAVIAESLRLYPPAWVIARRALADCEFDGVTVPAGSLVVMSQFLLHRDPRYFPRPLAFEPARWLDADATPPPKLAYFPFGAGPRSCIGESLAWMEAVLIVAAIAPRVRLASDGDPFDVEPRVTLRPKSSVTMQVERRA